MADIHEPDFAPYTPLVGFEAFLSAQRVFGWVRLDADRLTDLLNAHDLLHIIAVIASGPRGDPGRRAPTQRHAVAVESGVYRIGGCVHATAGVDPEARWRSGGPMVPLTGAWIEYRSGDRYCRDILDAVIVNRRLTTRVEVATRPAVMPARLQRRTRSIEGAQRPTGLDGPSRHTGR